MSLAAGGYLQIVDTMILPKVASITETGYTMRRSEKAMTRQQAREFLAAQKVGRLGLCDGDHPYIVPLHYVADNGCIYMHSAQEGRKIDLLNSNPEVCFEVDEFRGFDIAEQPCSFGTFYRSVIAYGKAHLVTGAEEKRQALSRLVRHCTGQDAHLPEEAIRRTTVIRLDIQCLTGKQHPQQ